MIVISNATPLIGLSMLGRFELLREVFGTILISTAVYDELIGKGADRGGAAEVTKGVADGWISVANVTATPILTTLKVDLDEGEAEAITLALERHADLLLLDERKGRAKANALGLEVTGTIGILLLAREKGIEIDLRFELRQLKTQGFRISDSLIERIVKEH